MELELTEEQIAELADKLLDSFPELSDVNGTIIRAEKYTREIISSARINEALSNYSIDEIKETYPRVIEECINRYLTIADDPKGYISTMIFLVTAKNCIAYEFEIQNLNELDYIVGDIIEDKYTELNNSDVKMQAKRDYSAAFENPRCKQKKEYPEVFENPVLYKQRKYFG